MNAKFEQTASRTKTPSILVVDDDLDTLQNLSDILGDMGYDVATASNGPAALELVRQRPFDVALLDFKMPEMDGLTLYREIRKLRAETVAMIVTAYANPATIEDAQQAGAWQVLSKPVEFSRLLPLVEQAVDQPLVLVIDDDQDLCQSLWDLLREQGYRIALAHDVGDAVRQIREGQFQVLLIDLRLPGGSGVELLAAAHSAEVPPRTVLITGYRSELQELVRQALGEGADAVCYKPFNVKELLQTIGRLVPVPPQVP